LGLFRGCSSFLASQTAIAFFQFTAFDAINASLTIKSKQAALDKTD